MASVFRKTYTKPLPGGAEIFTRKGEQIARWKDGKGKTRTAPLTTGRDGSDRIVVTAGTYTAKYRDGDGVVREVSTGCRTKDGAFSVLKDLTDRAERVRSKILTVVEAKIADHQHTPLARHFAEYLQHLEAGGASEIYLADTKGLATRLFDECGFNQLPDIQAEPVEKWLTQQTKLDMGHGLGISICRPCADFATGVSNATGSL